jgi:signal transduction histidine kinase
MDGPARPHRRWRRALLFGVAMLVPCAVLVMLGLRTIEDERRREDERLASAREALADRTRQQLLAELETLKFRQMSHVIAHEGRIDLPPLAPVAFAGALRDGALLLPWEHAPAAAAFKTALESGSFAERLSKAETLESAELRYEESAAAYRTLIAATEEPALKIYARLSLARVLQAAERPRDSEAELGLVLAAPAELVDQENVPLGLYAAAALVEAGASRERVEEWLDTLVRDDRVLSRPALEIAHDLATTLGASRSETTVTALIGARDRVAELQRNFVRVSLALSGGSSVWIANGDPAWLIGVTQPVGAFEGLVLAVRADEMLERLNGAEGPVRLATSTDPGGVSLGDTFPGLRVVLPVAGEPRRSGRETLLLAGLLLAIALTVVAGGLLWRDVQRDLRLAEMRSQFVASVSHELRTPLAAIRMFTETLKLDDDVDRNTRAEYLDTILHESERLSRLVDNVLDFGRIERGQKAYRFEPVALDEVVANTARTAQYPLERAGFALHLDVETGVPRVLADADALQQAILNLLSNAMKYSGDSRRIDLRLDRQNGHARIQVEDRGIGVAPQEQARVFDRFYRSASAANQHVPGAGLGLTLVAHIASAHGGRVDVRSSAGQGSTFTICLPLEGRRTALS